MTARANADLWKAASAAAEQFGARGMRDQRGRIVNRLPAPGSMEDAAEKELLEEIIHTAAADFASCGLNAVVETLATLSGLELDGEEGAKRPHQTSKPGGSTPPVGVSKMKKAALEALWTERHPGEAMPTDEKTGKVTVKALRDALKDVEAAPTP